VDTLPINRNEIDIMLAGLKDLQLYYTSDREWSMASKIDRIHEKLKINLSRYEDVGEISD
jgi:hypothetical protein